MTMMIFETLFFLGLFSMFVFILVGQEKVIKCVQEELRENRKQISMLQEKFAKINEVEGIYIKDRKDQSINISNINASTNPQDDMLFMSPPTR